MNSGFSGRLVSICLMYVEINVSKIFPQCFLASWSLIVIECHGIEIWAECSNFAREQGPL